MHICLSTIRNDFNFLSNILAESSSTKTLIDQSTLEEIPLHLSSCLCCFLNKNGLCTQIDAMTAILISLAHECGFVGDWLSQKFDVRSYALSWSSSFDRRLLLDSSNLPKGLKFNENDEDSFGIPFFYSISPQQMITVNCVKSSDLLIVVAHHQFNETSVKVTKSLAIPISRYVVRPRIPKDSFATNFRHLRELSIKLKNQIFLPLRDEIQLRLSGDHLYPSLLGIPDEILLLIIRRYLKANDINSLSLCCKRLNKISSPYLNNKSKVE